MQIFQDILQFFVSNAYAAESSAETQGGGMSLLIMTVIFLAFMYLLIWRPQSKRAKEHRNLMSSLAKGDEVVTAGGILGRISKVTDSYIVLALSDSIDITIQKSSISNVLPKGTLKSIA